MPPRNAAEGYFRHSSWCRFSWEGAEAAEYNLKRRYLLKNTEGFPFMVKLGLLGIQSRKAALAYFWFSNALSLVSLIAGFMNPMFFIGLFFLFSSLWYWLCIKWVDRNARWDK